MGTIEVSHKIGTYTKYLLDNRYAVYIHDCSNQDNVFDTLANKDITNTEKGIECIISARAYRKRIM